MEFRIASENVGEAAIVCSCLVWGNTTGCHMNDFLLKDLRLWVNLEITGSWQKVGRVLAALAEFFYTKKCDKDRCFCCGLEISGWEQTEDPLLEHFSRKKTAVTIKTSRNPTFSPLCCRNYEVNQNTCTGKIHKVKYSAVLLEKTETNPKMTPAGKNHD